MTETALGNQPITGPERIDMLDALRGFALFGILLMNLEAFTGPIIAGDNRHRCPACGCRPLERRVHLHFRAGQVLDPVLDPVRGRFCA